MRPIIHTHDEDSISEQCGIPRSKSFRIIMGPKVTLKDFRHKSSQLLARFTTTSDKVVNLKWVSIQSSLPILPFGIGREGRYWEGGGIGRGGIGRGGIGREVVLGGRRYWEGGGFGRDGIGREAVLGGRWYWEGGGIGREALFGRRPYWE